MEDIIAFNHHHLGQNHAYKRRRLISLYGTPLTFFLAFSLLAFVKDKPQLFIGSIIFYLWSFVAYKNYPKKCAETFQKEVLCEHKVIISETGVCEYTENSSSQFNWNALDKIETNDEYIFVYNTPVTAYVIPCREIGDEVFQKLKVVLTKGMQNRSENK